MHGRIMPVSIRVDASTLCQLHCPLCPRATGEVQKGLGVGWLRPETLRAILDSAPHVRNVELSNWGEVFLNPDLGAILELGFERGVRLSAEGGVNLNYLDEDTAEALVRFQFQGIKCAIDGATVASYVEYRRGGSLEMVLGNVERINAWKRRLESSLPKLWWQLIPFSHNENEIALAKTIAQKHDMEFVIKLSWESLYLERVFSPVRNRDLIRMESGLGVADRAEYREKFGAPFLQRRACAMLWREPQVNWDGRVLGCVVNYWGDYGNAVAHGLSECLNGERMRYARQMLTGAVPERSDVPCAKCPHFRTMKQDGNWLRADEVAQR